MRSTSFSISLVVVTTLSIPKCCFAKCCVWSALDKAVGSGRLSSLTGSEFLYAPSQAPTDSCLIEKGYSWVLCNQGDCRAVNCATNGNSGYVLSIYGGYCGGTLSTVTAIQSAMRSFAPSASCRPISFVETYTTPSESNHQSVSSPSLSLPPPAAVPAAVSSVLSPTPTPEYSPSPAGQAPAPSLILASGSACEANCIAPQTCMTCKQEVFGSSGVAVPSGAVSVSGGGGSSSQTSFCVDQTNPNLVIMYRKINACSAIWEFAPFGYLWIWLDMSGYRWI